MIENEFPKVKVAAVHAASVFLDLDACVDKACGFIAQCAANGAKLIVFPEAFIPGYPFWIWTHTAFAGSALYQKLFANSVTLDGDAVKKLGASARKAGAYVVIGVTEREHTSLYNTLLFFDDQGELIGRHRKLQMTHMERVIWSRGDGEGLKIYDTPHGRLGGLICGEHSLDLVRHALTCQHEQIHVSVWPGLSAISYNPRAAIFSELSEVAARYHAFAGPCFVISVHSRVDEDTIAKLGLADRPDMIRTGGGHTMIVSPDGVTLAGPHLDDEDVLYAELDLTHIIRARQIYDSTGHYSRSDVVQLQLNQHAPSGMLRTPAAAPADRARAGETHETATPAPTPHDNAAGGR